MIPGLTDASEDIYHNLFEGMFANSPRLANVNLYYPYIMGHNIYKNMFAACPILNTANLYISSKPQMNTECIGLAESIFDGCINLSKLNASINCNEIPAARMFANAFNGTQVNSLTINANSISDLYKVEDPDYPLYNWLGGASNRQGTITKPYALTLTENSDSGIPTNWTVINTGEPPTPPEPEKPDLDVFDPNVPFCIENVGDAPVEIGMYNYTEAVRTNCEISYDLQSWQNYNLPITQDANSTTISKITLTNKGDRVYIKADLVADPGSFSKITVFNKSSTKKIRARGNIASLNKGTNDAYKTDYLTTNSYCYANLFSDCGSSLTQAPELPATTLTSNCYDGMFRGCTSLTQAPELPATTLAYMCYNSMFRACASLTQAPELPAITLANYCYSNMFQDCTSLTQAPELPATTLSIVCYQQMFQGCTKLNYVKCFATDISAANCTASWLKGVATTGDFYAPASTNWTTNSYSGIPSGWTRHNV